MKLLKLILLLLFFLPIVSVGQVKNITDISVDSITNRFGFEVSSSTYATQPFSEATFPYTLFDIYYKYNHSKFILGDDISSFPNDTRLGIQIGYQYYLIDKIYGTSLFTESHWRYIYTNDIYIKGYYDLIVGFGLERNLLRWLNISCYFGIGVEVFNNQAELNQWYYNPYPNTNFGLNFNPNGVLNLKLSVILQ